MTRAKWLFAGTMAWTLFAGALPTITEAAFIGSIIRQMQRQVDEVGKAVDQIEEAVKPVGDRLEEPVKMAVDPVPAEQIVKEIKSSAPVGQLQVTMIQLQAAVEQLQAERGSAAVEQLQAAVGQLQAAVDPAAVEQLQATMGQLEAHVEALAKLPADVQALRNNVLTSLIASANWIIGFCFAIIGALVGLIGAKVWERMHPGAGSYG